MMKNSISILLFAFCGFILLGCRYDPMTDLEPDRQVVISFTASGSLLKSDITTAENKIEKIIFFGVSKKGDVIQNFPYFTSTQSITLTISRKVKWLYVIANPTTAHEDANPSNVSDLMGLTGIFVDLPQSPFLMSGIGEVNGDNVNIELIKSVAKIEISSDSKDFQITSVEVQNIPNQGYVFQQETTVTMPVSASPTQYSSMNTILYIPENTKENPVKFKIAGFFNGEPVEYTFSLKVGGNNIDIVRNTHYQVSITPRTEDECTINVSIPEWIEAKIDKFILPNFGTYYAADFHQHTTYTDGSLSIAVVFQKSHDYGTDVMVNSEHGGSYRGIWRWNDIIQNCFPQVITWNQKMTATLALQGFEWNVPGHEHCSMGIIKGQLNTTNPNAYDVAEFEYKFDNNDTDVSGGYNNWIKSDKIGHEKTMEAAQWLHNKYRYESWLVPAHPERRNGWSIKDFRELNDIAPDIFVAFEGIPGHQASTNRGEYGGTYVPYKSRRTFGGVGIMAAIGELWDAMISENRRFWLVANSDFHSHISSDVNAAGDFYPGEYLKTYISMKSKTAQGFVDGLRSGNIYCVQGNLIDRLEFSIGTATMGEAFYTSNSTVKVRILVRDPDTDNPYTTTMRNPVLHHIDLIAGKMRPRVGTAEYSVDTYANVSVIARFDATGGITDGKGITSIQWLDLGGGLKLIEYPVEITGDTYFRLRGTNNALNVSGKTDANGNPEEDVPNQDFSTGARVAFENLWFYSNPIFVRKN